MDRLSVMIPSRNEPFLERTVEDAFAKAAGDVEVIVLLDGAPAVEPLGERKGLRVLENAEAKGIGAASWRMAMEATGKYVMKLDAHCLLAEGYDLALAAQCGSNDLCVPTRYRLQDETWTAKPGRIEYLYLTYPWIQEPQFGTGLHGKKWLGENGLSGSYWWPEKAWKGRRPTDEIMVFQGSCFFMHRDRFLELDGVHRECILWQESTSIAFKVWLSGGRCLRVKTTWYAHLHKGQRHGRGYWLNKRDMQQINDWSADYWLNDRWEHPLKVRDIRWWVEHFWPIPGWPDDWDSPHYQAKFETAKALG